MFFNVLLLEMKEIWMQLFHVLKTLVGQNLIACVAHFHVMISKLFVNKCICSMATVWAIEVLLAHNIKRPSLSLLAPEKITVSQSFTAGRDFKHHI